MFCDRVVAHNAIRTLLNVLRVLRNVSQCKGTKISGQKIYLKMYLKIYLK